MSSTVNVSVRVSVSDNAITAHDPLACVPKQEIPLQSENIRNLLMRFSEELDVHYTFTSPCQNFYNACYEDMARRGWSSETVKDLQPYFPGGAMISLTAYAHLESLQARVLIANYTTLLIYLDDLYDDHIEAIRIFNVKFQRNERQNHRVLDALALLLQDLPLHFGDASRVILTSTLNYITALILEHEIPKTITKNAKSAAAIAQYVRQLSGVAEPYALFAFPPSIPWTSYIHALPRMVYFIATTNDVLSLYKEELQGEVTNTISILAAAEGTSKTEMAHKIGLEAIKAEREALALIEDAEARAAWDSFKAGYVTFHTSLPRYKLREILRGSS